MCYFRAMQRGLLIEYFKIALQSIKTQLLRTILTSLIIAIGIMALVGILTAIDAIQNSLTGQFALLGANTFSIQNRENSIRIGGSNNKRRNFPVITYAQAQQFKEKMQEQPALISLSFSATGTAEVKHGNRKTNPNISVMAVDENYLATGGYSVGIGRNFGLSEIERAAPVAVIGQDLVDKIFGEASPLGEFIQVGGERLRVVGTLASKGNAIGFGGDNALWIPISKARSMYGGVRSYSVNVMGLRAENLEAMVQESTAKMRAVRRLDPKTENDFGITRSDSLSAQLLQNLRYVSLAAILIAAITLLGAAIALMNIMLVSVTERTREIGIRKALGASRWAVMSQFLIEAIAICLLGGLAGIIFGIAIGNGTSALIGGSFIIPWAWMLLSAVLCFVVGLISGFYPAFKASRLDPIESLRYE